MPFTELSSFFFFWRKHILLFYGSKTKGHFANLGNNSESNRSEKPPLVLRMKKWIHSPGVCVCFPRAWSRFLLKLLCPPKWSGLVGS